MKIKSRRAIIVLEVTLKPGEDTTPYESQKEFDDAVKIALKKLGENARFELLGPVLSSGVDVTDSFKSKAYVNNPSSWSEYDRIKNRPRKLPLI